MSVAKDLPVKKLIIVVLLAGCNSGNQSRSTLPDIIPPKPLPPPIDATPIEPSTPVIPAVPLEPSTPIPPQQPIFKTDNITVLTQQLFIGVINRDGSAWIYTESPVKYAHELASIDIDVKYRYEPVAEFYMVDHSGEYSCTRYSLRTKSFGAAKPYCLWSNVRDDIQLADFTQSYYGYRIVGVGVYFNGIGGEMVLVSEFNLK